jgi:hypothetical protein
MVMSSGLNHLLTAVMIVISLYFAGRLVVAWTCHRRIHVEVNVAELVMGVAMAGMLQPRLHLLPKIPWVVVFAGFALWFVMENVRFVSQHGFIGGDAFVAYHRAHYPLHVLMSCSMLYMFLGSAPTIRGQMVMAAPRGTAADFVGLPLLFAALLCGFAVWQLNGLNRPLLPLTPADARDSGLVATAIGAEGDVQEAVVSAPPTLVDRSSVWLAPRLEAACLITMSIVMAFLLILMV